MRERLVAQSQCLLGVVVNRSRHSRRGLAAWQAGREPERTAVAHLAVDPAGAAHQRGQPLGDGQPQPGAAELAGDRCVGLLEFLEQARNVLGGNANARVLH